jgi:hypothetical protein
MFRVSQESELAGFLAEAGDKMRGNMQFLSLNFDIFALKSDEV